MKWFAMIWATALLGLLAACNDDDSFTVSPSCLLTFSADTVDVDTVFSNVPSATRSFWVYNRSGNGLRCTSVRLERGNQSGYRVNVDGTYLGSTNGFQTTDVEIRDGDSIRVFVELTAAVQHQDQPKLVEDNLLFTLESGVVQKVSLKAHSWDAKVLNGLEIQRDTTIVSATPILIRGGLHVQEGATLTIGAGTTLYFHDDAALTVDGTLRSEGTALQPVVLRGDRIDRMFDYLPYDYVSGQWRGIRFTATSYGNLLQYTDIHSAYDGVVADSADVERMKVEMNCTTVHNCKGYGLKLDHVKASLNNCQITNTLADCVWLRGSNVAINHCTIAQFYPFDGNRGFSLRFLKPLPNLLCRNTLLTGYADDVLQGEADESCHFRFEDCIIRTPKVETADSVYFTRVEFEDIADTAHVGRRHFLKIDTDNLRYNFALDSVSTAVGKANPSTSIPYDRMGRQRDDQPDIGAFEYLK